MNDTAQPRSPIQRRVRIGPIWWVLGVLLLALSVGMVAVSLFRAAEAAATDNLRVALETPAPFDVQGAGAVVIDPAPENEYPANTLAAPAASLTVPLESTGLNAKGDLAIPSAEHAGVYTGSAPLTSDTGSTLIAGHVTDRLGEFAPMSQLALLAAGDAVVTVDAEGNRQDWTVVASTVTPRTGLPDGMWQPTGERKLVLITCAGPTQESDGSLHFTGNLIVTAVPR